MRTGLSVWAGILLAAGINPAGAQEEGPPLLAANEEGERTAQDGSVFTRRDARTLNLSIPAPRGLIADRNGEPLAQNKVAYYFALEFPHFEKPEDAVILEWAHKRISQAREWTGREWEASDEALLAHYKDRRWVPFVLPVLAESGDIPKFKDKLPRGLILHPVYLRHYPQRYSASHIIGYVRSKGKLPTGPINYGDPLFEETHGVAGLEKMFDEQLTGDAGQRKIIFDSDGTRLLDELEKPPRVGNTVITTLNLDWQKHAESVLRRSCKRGAFVVIDIQSGEVLVLASRPYYDVNVWIPTIGQKEFEELRDDPSKPMFGRAFQGSYPPASTFKPIVAVTALTNNEISRYTKIDCPAKIKIGATTFHNHSKYPDGKIDVKKALARSNNVWFYKVGMMTGAESFLSVARRLGFGTPTGLPLFGENPGRVPTNEFMKETLGRPITQGDTANFAIGQGALEGSPLHVAQAMAGLANGRVLPRLRLVRQIQDPNGGVVLAPEPEARNTLALDSKAVDIVHDGMMEVVHAGYGTGERGALSFCKICGKTGTAQWVKDRELAWFAGFLPYDNPRFAFAALYEGMPHEVVSGGKKAAPMIPRFFEPLKEE
ncbi:MAG: hypothetical protein HKO57_06635, partial [Akkermansiaceae bacterium]|nr:hypothetical protein [Akkermansiaceae bacterium]